MRENMSLQASSSALGSKPIGASSQDFLDMLDVQRGCSPHELTRTARTSVALDRLAETHELGSFAYYYQGLNSPESEDIMSSLILGTSLLTARGIPVAGEYEVKKRPGHENPGSVWHRRFFHRILRD